MLDTWETANGLNPINAADYSPDNDGDGLTNLQEYRTGTDPNSYFSPFPSRIIVVTLSSVVIIATVYILKIRKPYKVNPYVSPESSLRRDHRFFRLKKANS